MQYRLKMVKQVLQCKIMLLNKTLHTLFLFTILVKKIRTQDPLVEDLKIPQPSMGEFCGYQSCQRIKENVLNIHLVPSTLYELGFTKQFEEYYSGVDATKTFLKSEINMKKTLDSIVSELWADNTRRFTFSDLPYFFRWWKERDGTIRRMVHELVRQGRFIFVGGGWGLNDESTALYQSIIDSFTYGLRKLNETFGECGRPLVAWQADSFGHSREMANLLSGLGYDAVFINPISYDDELNRMATKSLEMIWRGSDDLGQSSDIFTHKLFDGYWSPPGLCFDNYCKDDNILDSDDTMSNVNEKVQEFISATVHRQAPYYRTNNIMIIMGARYAYYNSKTWFRNIDKLIVHANNQAINFGANLHAFYSTPACYLRAVYNKNPLLPIKQDDFLPVAHTDSDYFTGMYSSRPTFKYMTRVANIFSQIAKQLEVTAGMGGHQKDLDFIKWTLGVVQDRNILTGAHRPHVADYYKTKLYLATQKATKIMKDAFNKIRGVDTNISYYRCLFNESDCVNSNSESSYIIIYNPLSWPVSVNVRLPVSSAEYIISDSYGEFVDATAMPIPEQILQVSSRRTTANIELVFIAKNVPPLGFTSFFVRLKPIVNRRVLKSITLANNYEKQNIFKEKYFNVTKSYGIDENTSTTEDKDLISDTDKKIIPVLLGSHNISQNRSKKINKIINVETTEAYTPKKNRNFLISPEEESRIFNKTKALISKFYFGNNKTVPGKLFHYDHIKNKFVKIELDKNSNKVVKVILANGVEIFLDIQFYYYEAFVSNKTNDRQISSGPYIFKPKIKIPIQIFEKTKPNVFVSNIVKEIHINYADYASLVLRLYNNTSIIEVDWMIGPVPIEDGVGKEIILRYTTDLKNENIFYTDSNGRQTIKRRINERYTWKYEQIRQIVGNYYPVNSKIYIEDLIRNVRFSVFNDRPQGGGSLKEGEMELMIHRRLVSEETNAYFILNETEGDSGLIVRGKHYIFISEANSKVYKIFEKKFAKEIQLTPQIMISKSEPNILLRNFLKLNNQFSALKAKLPLGIHLLTLEPWSKNTMLLRFENYLEKNDIGNKTTKMIDLKNLFENLKIVDIKETTLGANMWKNEISPLQWENEIPFVKNFNNHYGSDDKKDFVEEEYINRDERDWKLGLKLRPMEIKTFVVQYKFQIH